MERLTERWCKGMVRIKGCSTAYPDKERKGAPMASAIARLADYEDIGTPDEINRIIDAYRRGLTLRTDVGERLEIVKDIQTERLKELAKAEKDGRLTVRRPNNPLTLSELWEMDFDDAPPVYITFAECLHLGYDLTGGYSAVEFKEDNNVEIWVPEWDITIKENGSNYGKTWLAYRRKPEEM